MILKYFVISFCAFFFIFNTQAFAVDSYAVGAGTTATIDEFGVCKDVTNSLGVGIMVPTKTANEWHTGGSSFLENLYAGVSVVDCPPACAGTLVGGYCWYAGGNYESCTTVCSTHAGVNIGGTRNYAGSAGTDANCLSVLVALGIGVDFIIPAVTGPGLGCHVEVSTFRVRSSPTTTGSARNLGAFRACACNN